MSNTSPALPVQVIIWRPVPIAAVVDPAARPVRRSLTSAYRAQVAEYEAAPYGETGLPNMMGAYGLDHLHRRK